MKKYTVQSGDTFESLAGKLKVKDGGFLKTFHNLNCPEKDITQEPLPGMEILIPDDPQFLKTESDFAPKENALRQDGDTDSSQDSVSENEGQDTMNEETSEENQEENSKEEEEEEEEKKKQSESSSSAHDGKYFVVQKGMCQCNQGFKFPKFKVTSHQKHYWNDAEGQADYLAVTEDDLTLDPPAMPFGNCKLKPTSGGYLPCAFAPAGKWTKTYEKVKVMGKSCVTEISELMCSTGGKITVFKHGQQSEAGKSNVAKANAKEQQVYNPVVDFEVFQEEDNEDDYQ